MKIVEIINTNISIDTKNVLESFGVSSSKIKFELFTSPVIEDNSSNKENLNVDFDGESHVTVIYDDEEVEFSLSRNGETILDAAMDNDLDVPFSCNKLLPKRGCYSRGGGHYSREDVIQGNTVFIFI